MAGLVKKQNTSSIGQFLNSGIDTESRRGLSKEEQTFGDIWWIELLMSHDINHL